MRVRAILDNAAMTDPPPKARSMLFDLYGDFATHAGRGGRMRLSVIVRLAADLGISEAAVRSAASRLVADGWLTGERRGRERIYVLAPRGRRLVAEGRDRIFSRPNSEWDGSLCVVALSVPEARREVRDRMRKELSWLGFGSPSSALYVSPRDHRARVMRLAGELKASEYLQVYRAKPQWPADPRQLVARTWSNLAAVNRRYREFVRRFAGRFRKDSLRTQGGRQDGRAAFQTRFALANHFRKCLFDDPDLPMELLPAGWQGHVARRLFLEYHELVSPAALAYFDKLSETKPNQPV